MSEDSHQWLQRYIGLTQGPDELAKLTQEVQEELAKVQAPAGKVFVQGLGPGHLGAGLTCGTFFHFVYSCDDGEPRPRAGDYLLRRYASGRVDLFRVVEAQRERGDGYTCDHVVSCMTGFAGHFDGRWNLDRLRRRPWWVRIPKAAAAPFVWTALGVRACAVEPTLRSDLLGITLLLTPLFLLLGYITYFDNPAGGILVACLGFAPHALWVIVEGFRRRGC
jgi:hypothetical protein